MPFKGDKFTRATLLTELKAICNTSDITSKKIDDVWNRVVGRFNKAAKATDFVKLMKDNEVAFGDVIALLDYCVHLSQLTHSNIPTFVGAANTAKYTATTLIPMYYTALIKVPNAHRKGTFRRLLEPYKKYTGGAVHYQIYRNEDDILPALATGHYIEWYASGKNEKRFFTAPGQERVWYTDGGTHDAADFWCSENPDASSPVWERFYLAPVE
jgi:hypothetical protein